MSIGPVANFRRGNAGGLLAVVFVFAMSLLGLVGNWYARSVSPDVTSSSIWVASGALNVVFAITALVVLFRVVRWRAGGYPRTHGKSMLSLVSEYRSFASSTVNRVTHGALGSSIPPYPVLVCIDELDKIARLDETRLFVRNIKAIFEVPGVYYYVSLAEDSLAAMYLGTSKGKNEIDSSFDHIVRVPPLSCREGAELAKKYLGSRGVAGGHPRMCDTISAVSYGVPRDVFRRCDECLARDPGFGMDPVEFVASMRSRQVQLAYEANQLSHGQVDTLGSSASVGVESAKAIVTDRAVDAEARRVVLAVWLACRLELGGASIESDDVWAQVSEDACRFGYRIASDPVEDLIADVLGMQSSDHVPRRSRSLGSAVAR